MRDFSLKVSKDKIITYLFILYLICFTSYNLNQGFDDYVVKIVPLVLILVTTMFNYKNLKITKLLIWFIVFWCFYLLSFIWAQNRQFHAILIPKILYLFPSIFCLPYIIKNKDDINKIFKYIIIALLYSLFLLFIRGEITQIGSERIGFSIGLSPNAVGMRFAIGSFLCLYFLHEKNTNKKLYIMLLLIFVIFGLFTGSRKAALMIFLGLPSFEILISKGTTFFFKCIIGLLLAFGLVYIVFNNQYLYNVLGYRFETMMSQIGSDDKIDGSVFERDFYKKQAMSLFKKKPIYGVGGNNFAAYMSFINYRHVAYSHNNFTELLATLGIIGFILYYYAWFKIIILIIKDFIRNKTTLNLLLTIIIGLYIIMDYGNVSYYDVFHILMLSIGYIYIKVNDKIKGEPNELTK